MAEEPEGPDFRKGVSAEALTEDKPLLGHVDGEPIIVVKSKEGYNAIGATCSHYGGPLHEGLVVGHTVRCPWHHACFDLRSGKALGGPALMDLPCFLVKEKDGKIFVENAQKGDSEKGNNKAKGPENVVILGAGAAGAACAEMLRQEGYEGPITMLDEGPDGPVDRPNLSKDYLAGQAPEEWLYLGGDERWEELQVKLVKNLSIVKIDAENKELKGKGGESIAYDALLYATGARARVIPIPKTEAAKVFTLRSLKDSRAIIEAAKDAQSVVVIGASFIGLEVAASLRQRGLDVHVVGPETTPLERVLGQELGQRVREIHEERGVQFHLSAKPKRFLDKAVELEDGRVFDADFVVMGVGAIPNVELAKDAGLDCGSGVIVNAHMESSKKDIWVAGDVAEYPSPRQNRPFRIEHWAVAERQGQAAARSILGQQSPFNDVPFFWSAHYDVQISYVGHAREFDEVKVDGDLQENDATVVYKNKGEILAVATLGRDILSLKVEAAMEAHDQEALKALLA